MDVQPINEDEPFKAYYLPQFPPAFDKESPDAAILEAFETVRAMRAFSYADDPDGTSWSTERQSEHDDEMQKAEAVIYGTIAKTPTGIAAKIILTETVECDRGFDIAFADYGILALYHRRDGLDRRIVTRIEAAYQLLLIEWNDALAAYERSDRDFTLALKLRSLVDLEKFRVRDLGEDPNDFLDSLDQLADRFEDQFSNHQEIARLFRTLAPDWFAYRRKAEIAVKEGEAETASPWLLRDANFLMSAIGAWQVKP